MNERGLYVSVVAPTYKRRAALPEFIEPILAQSEVDELVIAVDGSADGSVEWLRERARSDDRLIALDLPNRGAGPARQAGLEAASGDVVVLLDDDVIIEPGLVSGHVCHHQDLQPKLVLGYMPNDWRTVAPERRSVAYIYRRAYDSHVRRWLVDPEAVLHGLWGGNLSMPRRDMLRVGIHKLAVARGQDDREFGLRCLKAGVQGLFDPNLRALHLYDRSFEAFRSDCRLQGRSRQLIHDVHHDLLGHELVRTPVGPETPDAVGLNLHPRIRSVWPRLALDPSFKLFGAACERAHRFGVAHGHFGLEVWAAQGVGSLETMRGVAEATRYRYEPEPLI